MRRALALLLLAACAPSLSSFQPAHVAPRGHVQAETGFDVSIPTGTITKTIDAAKTLAKAAETRMLTEQEQREVIEAGANLALNPPSAIAHFGLTFVPIERWELGLRHTSGAWRLGIRHHLIRTEERGWDLSLGVGLQRFKYEFPVEDIIGILALDDFQRWSLDVPIIAGKQGSWYRLWGGPRLLFTKYSTALRLVLPNQQATAASVDGSGALLGLQGGLALGYRWLFVGIELTIVRAFSSATLALAGLEQDVDLGGWVVYPGVALMGEF